MLGHWLRGARTSAHEEIHAGGGTLGVVLLSVTGMVATGISLVLVLVPPPGTTSAVNYEVNVVGQTLLLVACGLALYWWAKRRGVES